MYISKTTNWNSMKFGTQEVYIKYCFVNLILVYSVLKKDINN